MSKAVIISINPECVCKILNGECADLRDVNLSGADLSGANLYNADLSDSNLYCADLSGADLSGANLNGANLYNADLSFADLSGANLSGANLYNADLNEKEKIRLGYIVEKPFIGYKKCYGGVIVTLEILTGSIVFSINNKKCRTNKVKVIAINGDTTEGLTAKSQFDSNFVYEVGKIICVENFNLQYNVECSTGIHFFKTKKEAEDF